tara:strand:+ start:130 stop:402 length:273 start_codon:yes stop_codon:yes gene_type:complete
MMELIGYIGSICLALCAIPQAWLSYKQGHSQGISIYFLLMWTLGELFTLVYVIPMLNAPLILNYSGNVLFLAVIWKYKLLPKKSVETKLN